MRTGFIGWHVLQEGMYYCRISSGSHVFRKIVIWEDMSCRRTCLMGGHVLWEVMYYGDMSCSETDHEVRNVIHDDSFVRF